MFENSVTFRNFTSTAIHCEAGFIHSKYGTTFNFINSTASNTGTAFVVNYGGQIHLNVNNTVNLTKVNKSNVSIGTASNTGWITGA